MLDLLLALEERAGVGCREEQAQECCLPQTMSRESLRGAADHLLDQG